MNKRIIGLLLLLFCLSACFKEASFGEEIIPYYPPSKILKDGYVNKYYLNSEVLENNVKSTNIIYEKVQLKGDNLQLTQYSSGFNKRRESEFGIDSNGLNLIKEKIYFARDSTISEIRKSQELLWDENIAEKEYKRNFKGYYAQEFSSSKQFEKDTMWESRPARKFKYNSLENRQYESGEDRIIEEKGHLIVAEGLGVVSFYTMDSLSFSEKLLIEQMSMEDFNVLANHGTHRVAYIDSSSTLDKARKDLLCGEQEKIYDYYNSPTPAGFHNGKGPLKQHVSKMFDQSKISKESGFLTFRFVINCQGEAGWFTLEQADLDYQKKEFSETTVRHLLTILQAVPSWNQAVINDEEGDAYAYITFKLKDGEIFEMLP